ncbi:uncharacterized protein LOC110184653 [Drosophila serrata]|uniref:uncharacterized protein LOC110184653 n=1 Tax=Drosophila serrata TaxID=7274 RepID=UPI000A1D0EC0|nr:uncharacterized protein LOC110184653 [Drosophila serrata]
MHNSDDVPFNPFYIGPHPSKACAAPEVPGQQCSPDCQDGHEDSANQAPAAPPAGQAGGLLIIGMVGPTGGVATIFSTTEAQVAAAKGASPDNPCPGKMIDCMQGGKGSEKPCE